MTRANITERTEEEVIVSNEAKFFRPVYAKTPAIPITYDGKYVCLLAVVLDVKATEAQMDLLETSITSTSGVHNAFCLIGPARIPLDRVPSGYDLNIGVEGKFNITPEPIEE